jgi:hypothetical protein
MKKLILAIALAVSTFGTAYADSLPIVPVGTTITGTMTVNPNTPIFLSFPNAVNWDGDAGSITATIGGETFAGPIGTVVVQTPPACPSSCTSPFWEAKTNQGANQQVNGTLNGNILPSLIFGMTLSGGTYSTSILPQAFSSYSFGELEIIADDNLGERVLKRPHRTANGSLTSLTSGQRKAGSMSQPSSISSLAVLWGGR